MFTPPQPDNLASTIVSVIFYLIMIGLTMYSLIALYSLLRFGLSKTMSLIIAVIYLIVTGGLFLAAVANLNQI